ncbi:hypothetical protein AB0F05_37090 [Streptomyces microflavus]|uniref:3-phosphoshikimate 1-carboxyvinyltransferase n=1 Tax=Streptomyces microflavus TaxID=1919 RepID=A0A7H8N013_STRMI|nr:hypothetical protein [Streptomyces microflavus]QKW47805.1 hypothetical protein HUT09_35245 [Streptomyces microflavus]
MLSIQKGVRGLAGMVTAPASKPHTQRALVTGALARSGTSTVTNAAWSRETRLLLAGLNQFGATSTVDGDRASITVDPDAASASPIREVDVAGSAFTLRVLGVLAAVSGGTTHFRATRGMMNRPVAKHLGALTHQLGAVLSTYGTDSEYAISIKGRGRRCDQQATHVIDTVDSSQLVTALMLSAPFISEELRMRAATRRVVGAPYIALTREVLGALGVSTGLAHSAQHGWEWSAAAEPGGYPASAYQIATDFTSITYFAVVAAAGEAGKHEVVVKNFTLSGLESEDLFFRAIAKLGIGAVYDPDELTLRLRRTGYPSEPVVIDGSDVPTAVTSLAAIAAYSRGAVTVVNCGHVNNHKTRRVELIVETLARMGFDICEVRDHRGAVTGFHTEPLNGAPRGGIVIGDDGDHRILLPAMAAAVGASNPVGFSDLHSLIDSFPEFVEQLEALGAVVDRTQTSS